MKKNMNSIWDSLHLQKTQTVKLDNTYVTVIHNLYKDPLWENMAKGPDFLII